MNLKRGCWEPRILDLKEKEARVGPNSWVLRKEGTKTCTLSLRAEECGIQHSRILREEGAGVISLLRTLENKGLKSWTHGF